MTRVDPACLRLERRVAGFVARHDVLAAGERVLLLLSGGADSMALLAMLPAVDQRLGLGLHVAAAHVDYRTRGAASARDRQIVERACAAAGVPLEVLRLRRPLSGGDFQARARDVRYRFAREVAARQGLSVIAVAHNRDDQAETVLYRLSKYASPRGLVGMRPRDGDLARPLLCLGAGEIREYCRALGVEYGEDASNAAPVYSRNVLRLEVLPRLEALNPRLAETLGAAALQAAAEADVLAAAAEEARRRVTPAGGEPGPGEVCAAVEVAALAAEPPALRALVLHELARVALGGEALVERRLVEALLALAARPSGGGRVALGRGLEAVASRRAAVRAARARAPRVCPVDRLRRRARGRGGRPARPRLLRTPPRPPPGGRARLRAARGARRRGLRRAPAKPPPRDPAAPAARRALRPARPRRRDHRRAVPGGRPGPAQRRALAVVVDVEEAAAWVGFTGGDGLPRGRVAQAFGVDESSACTLILTWEGA